MQREEKQLESSIEALIMRVQEVKNSIQSFLMKLEHEYETLDWPTVLNNFALVSGQINSLNQLMKNEKLPLLRNQICLPLALAPDRDPELEKLTEGRVVAFNHEVVPDYLRTKPDPIVEEKLTQLTQRASQTPTDNMQKQLSTATRLSNQNRDLITNTREERESEMNQKAQTQPMSSQADTHLLIAATSFGKGIKRRMDSPGQPQRPPSTGQPGQPHQPPPGYPYQAGVYMGQQQSHMGKAPSIIKTNIKAATNVHSYTRP